MRRIVLDQTLVPATLVGLLVLIAGYGFGQSTGTKLAVGVVCTPITIHRDGGTETGSEERLRVAFPSGPCDEGAHASRVRIDLREARIGVLAGPHEGALIEASSPLDMVTATPLRSAGDSRSRPMLASNGGFFAAAPSSDRTEARVISVSTLGGAPGQKLPLPPELSLFSEAARCRIARRALLQVQCGATGCTASLGPEEWPGPTTHPESPGASQGREGSASVVDPREITAVIGGGGRLLPVPASRADTPPCHGEAGQPDPDWDRRRPRTAVGLRASGPPGAPASAYADDLADNPANNQWVEIFVSTHGLTIEELSMVARQLNWSEGLALDGGGSSQLWLFPWDAKPKHFGGARPVASALVVYGRQPTP